VIEAEDTSKTLWLAGVRAYGYTNLLLINVSAGVAKQISTDGGGNNILLNNANKIYQYDYS